MNLNQFRSNSSSKIRQNKLPSDNQTNFSQTMKKVLVLTQLYTFLLLTCGTRSMQKKTNQPAPNMKKDTVAKKHFGYVERRLWFWTICLLSDLRAKLEMAIDKVLNAVRVASTFSRHNHGFTDDDNSSSVTTSDAEDQEQVRTTRAYACGIRHFSNLLGRLRSKFHCFGSSTRTGTCPSSIVRTRSLRGETAFVLSYIDRHCIAL